MSNRKKAGKTSKNAVHKQGLLGRLATLEREFAAFKVEVGVRLKNFPVTITENNGTGHSTIA